MLVDKTKERYTQAHDSQERSNLYLQKKKVLEGEAPTAYFSSSISSLNPKLTLEASQKNEKIDVLDKKKHAFSDWVQTKYESMKVREIPKSTHIDSLNISQKKNNKSQIPAVTDVKQSVFSDAWDWVKNKWNSVLVYMGIRNPYVAPERDRSIRTKILERKSPNEIDEDFKYLDIANMDPLKVMVAILVQQGLLRNEQAFLVSQKVLLEQEDLKDAHGEKIQLQAELAVIDKRFGILEKVQIGTTGAQVLSFIATAAGVVAGAATIASGGVLAGPIAAVTLVLNGVVGVAQAGNTWLKGDTKKKMDELQSKHIRVNADRDNIQFQLKVDIKDIKKIFNTLTHHAEIGKALIDAQIVRK